MKIDSAVWKIRSLFQPVIARSFPLVFMLGINQINLGVLTVTASLDDVYQRLFNKALGIIGSNAVKTFLVAFFLLAIFRILVTRHLEDLVLMTWSGAHAQASEPLLYGAYRNSAARLSSR